MDMPSRIEIRHWLNTLSRSEVIGKLGCIKIKHGIESEKDVRELLNYERDAVSRGKFLFPNAKGTDLLSGEQALLSEHEQRKSDIAADIKSQTRLYSDADTKTSLTAEII